MAPGAISVNSVTSAAIDVIGVSIAPLCCVVFVVACISQIKMCIMSVCGLKKYLRF